MQGKTRGERLFSVFNTILLIGISLLCLLPFVTLFSKSVSDEAYVISGQIGFLPKGFQLDAYKLLMSSSDFLTAFRNSILITAVGTCIQVFFTSCVGYAITKEDLPGRKIINFLYVFTMMFNGGLIPTYLVTKTTGLTNNLLVMAVPTMVTAFNMILASNYFRGLPHSLEESARIDGAGNLTVMFRIIFPMSKPALATVALFCAVGIWNNYMTPLIYLQKANVRMLTVYLQNIITAAENSSADNPGGYTLVASESFRAAAVFISALPILIVYPLLQNYFVQGITLGAVKQ